MALGSQTALLEQQAARQEEQYRQQQQFAPLLYEQMGLRPQYGEGGQITGFERFETPEQALYREQIETMRAQQPQQAALQQQYLTLAQQQAEYQQRQQPIQERLQQQYLTLAEQQAAAQERQQPGQERLQALYMDIAEQQAKSQQLEAAWQQETAPQRRAQIENELRIQNQTLAYQETALRQYQEQQKMQPLLYEQAGVKPIYDDAGNITSFGLTEEGQKRQDYESQLLDRQRKALAGELPVDPTLERTLQEGETQLRAQLQAQLGTGYETSTPGIQALAEFSRRAAEARSNVAHGQLVSGQNLLANAQELLQRRQAGADERARHARGVWAAAGVLWPGGAGRGPAELPRAGVHCGAGDESVQHAWAVYGRLPHVERGRLSGGGEQSLRHARAVWRTGVAVRPARVEWGHAGQPVGRATRQAAADLRRGRARLGVSGGRGSASSARRVGAYFGGPAGRHGRLDAGPGRRAGDWPRHLLGEARCQVGKTSH